MQHLYFIVPTHNQLVYQMAGVFDHGRSPCAGSSAEGVNGDSPSHRSRLRRFEEVLNANRVDLRLLRKLAFHGIPDKDGLRATAWKVHSAHAGPSSTKHLPLPITGYQQGMQRNTSQSTLLAEGFVLVRMLESPFVSCSCC